MATTIDDNPNDGAPVIAVMVLVLPSPLALASWPSATLALPGPLALASLPLALLIVAAMTAGGARLVGRVPLIYPAVAVLVGSVVADVVVLGVGNSGMDIAVDASYHARTTYLAHRRGAHVLAAESIVALDHVVRDRRRAAGDRCNGRGKNAWPTGGGR